MIALAKRHSKDCQVDFNILRVAAVFLIFAAMFATPIIALQP
ncbi:MULTISPECIES: hypothetical protein [Thiorhodovibrio]|nr:MULTISPECIES: hypothetical protein [Thiorhodovibrio]